MRKIKYIQIPDTNNKTNKAFDLLFDEVLKKNSQKTLKEKLKKTIEQPIQRVCSQHQS